MNIKINFKTIKKEIAINKSSRSAKLRFATRSKNNFEYPRDLIKDLKNI